MKDGSLNPLLLPLISHPIAKSSRWNAARIALVSPIKPGLGRLLQKPHSGQCERMRLPPGESGAPVASRRVAELFSKTGGSAPGPPPVLGCERVEGQRPGLSARVLLEL